jgi:hypothetical protein
LALNPLFGLWFKLNIDMWYLGLHFFAVIEFHSVVLRLFIKLCNRAIIPASIEAIAQRGTHMNWLLYAPVAATSSLDPSVATTQPTSTLTYSTIALP